MAYNFATTSASVVLIVFLTSFANVVTVNNLTVTDVLRAIQSSGINININSSSSSSSSSSSNATTSSTDEEMNDDNNMSSLLMEAARESDMVELMSDPISDWLNQLTSSEGQTSSASSFVSSSILSVFIQQVTNRTALCHLLNGTCVLPANCAVLGLTLGYDYGRGSSSDIGKYFSCDASTICCYPFLLSSLSTVYNHQLGNHNDDDDDDDDDDSDELEGFDTVYEYWFRPHNRQQRRQRRPTGRYGKGRGHYKDSRRRYRPDRPPFARGGR